ncbi:MAG: glycoside hydrolase family 130 protein [Spirochaetota bacterium]|nr:glycoside hydrolase family 130 protein [Spirochaetota bacterium]
MHNNLNVTRKPILFHQDYKRVITRFHFPHDIIRISNIINRVLSLSDNRAKQILEQVMINFSHRHKHLDIIFNKHFNKVKKYITQKIILSQEKKNLIGAYFTNEYSIQSAAFFNPSIVSHMDQSNLDKNSIRLIMSFRSTGEGHISSIEFRSIIVNHKNEISLETISSFAQTADSIEIPIYDKHTFRLKLKEIQIDRNISNDLLEDLPSQFDFKQLKRTISNKLDIETLTDSTQQQTINQIFLLAKANLTLKFNSDTHLTERVIFPFSDRNSNGIEDARFVLFNDENGTSTYYATYTAYNGKDILTQLLETNDFLTFKMVTLIGNAVKNKGMALFPRKINGKYMMIARIDGENLYIVESDNIYFWNDAKPLIEPHYSWEFVQIGNCGSPIETEKGWILLTHGVGPMRHYCIGAILLDLNDPSQVIGSLHEPLLCPKEEEREGYVPNVVYTCGAIIHNGELIIPFGMSDTTSGIASVSVNNLLNNLLKNKK